MKKFILVIGGAGYIGSHMVRALLDADYQPVIFDNLSTGHRKMIPEEAVFIQGDLKNAADVASAFESFDFSAVLHFAASSIVAESVQEPLKYYRNNVAAFLNLLESMSICGVKNLIFSSTAAVYGNALSTPIREEATVRPLNPYGWSKWMMEKMLEDVSGVSPVSYVIFRYFNAAGAHDSGELGEQHTPETHLIPNLLAAAAGSQSRFTLFGDQYPTRDGTCVRDYVHVEDLCQAHLLALRYLEQGGSSEIFNLGSELGFSVKEVLLMAEQVTGRKIQTDIAARRPGDPAELIADSRKAGRILGWRTTKNLEEIIRSAYQWHTPAGPIESYKIANGLHSGAQHA